MADLVGLRTVETSKKGVLTMIFLLWCGIGDREILKSRDESIGFGV